MKMNPINIKRFSQTEQKDFHKHVWLINEGILDITMYMFKAIHFISLT
jgi:hypothetical protein